MNDPELPISEHADDALKEMQRHVSGEKSDPSHGHSSFSRSRRASKPKSTPEEEEEEGKHGGQGATGGRDFLTELEEDEEDEDVGFVQPKRSWFLSTAFPLIAGTFGPLASLFSICAIVEGWRVQLPDIPGVNGLESEGRPIKDPHWLIALNVVSLVSALIANLVLLFNFAQRIRYSLAQPITIILWYFSGFILIALLGVTPHLESQNAQTPHHRFSQSYYSGIISAALYLILSTLLLINFLTSSPMPYFPRRRTHKHHDEGDDQDTQRRKGASKSAMRVRKIYTHPPSFAPLTIPQRTLMLQSTFLTIYLGIGALIFSALQRHTFSPLTPTSQQSSSGGAGPNFNETLTFPSALYFVDYTILTIGLGSDFPLQTPAGRGVMVPYAMGGILMVGMVVGSVRGLVVERAKVKGWRRGVWKERRRVLRENQSFDGSDDGSEKLGKREKARSTSLRSGFDAEAFKAMRAIERKVSKKQDRLNTINATLAFLIVWFMGALVFYFTEKPQQWTYATSLYFTYVSLLTIGYGDFVPQSNSGRPFFVLWSLVAVPTVTVFISVVGSALVSGLKVSSVWIAQRTILPERPAPRSRSTTDVEGDTKHSKTSVDETQNDNKLGDKPVPDSKEEVALELKLVREISRLLEHLGKNGGTKHDWKEWDGWLGLLSLRSVEQESESDTDMVGDGGNLTRRGDGSSGSEGNDKKTDADMGWLHEDGPLFSDLSETEWVLARLCERLEKRLKEIDNSKKDR